MNTANELHTAGHRAITAVNWLPGSYLRLSDDLPITYHVYGNGQAMIAGHVYGTRPYRDHFDQAIWLPVEIDEDE